MRIVFMGTPDIAVGPLASLIEAGHEVCAVITRADKPKGRGYELMPTPVKAEALKHGIEVLHPKKLDAPEFTEKLKAYNADVFVVMAFGRLIPKVLLDMPRLGCINIHASLLPSYRGSAPIQWAVIDGRKQTGITTMQMNEGLDTGDILKQYLCDIEADETGGSLFDKMSAMAGPAICDTLDLLDKGQIVPKAQGDTDTAYARMFTKEDGLIDWSQPADNIERLIRGLDPWPGTYTYLNGKLLKIWKAEVSDMTSSEKPGTVIKESTKDLPVATGRGVLLIKELQPEGKKRMSTDAFLRGCRVESGTVFGKE